MNSLIISKEVLERKIGSLFCELNDKTSDKKEWANYPEMDCIEVLFRAEKEWKYTTSVKIENQDDIDLLVDYAGFDSFCEVCQTFSLENCPFDSGEPFCPECIKRSQLGVVKNPGDFDPFSAEELAMENRNG